jgi:hypothetical protein
MMRSVMTDSQCQFLRRRNLPELLKLHCPPEMRPDYWNFADLNFLQATAAKRVASE